MLGDTTQQIGGELGTIQPYSTTQPSPLSDQTVTLWEKAGGDAWTQVADSTSTTGPEGAIQWSMPSLDTTATILYKATYAGTSTYEEATSNIVGVKYENAESVPYLTTMCAGWTGPNPTMASGTITFEAALLNGQEGVGPANVTVWLWTGTTWVSYLTLETNSDGRVQVPVISETAGSAFLLVTSGRTEDSLCAGSKSNLVQLVWT